MAKVVLDNTPKNIRECPFSSDEISYGIYEGCHKCIIKDKEISDICDCYNRESKHFDFSKCDMCTTIFDVLIKSNR